MAVLLTPAGRDLLQSCPKGCTSTGCLFSERTETWVCNVCMGTLLPNKDGKCSCPPGQYVDVTTGTGQNAVAGGGTLSNPKCTDCPVSSYCEGGEYNPEAQDGVIPNAKQCPDNMMTTGVRARNILRCGECKEARALCQ